MYIPPAFNESRLDVLHAFIARNQMGMLINHGRGGLDANHIPFDLDAAAGEFGVLHAHVARNNPVWKDITTGDEVLAVFQGGGAYISPQWYPSEQQFHRQVPTWNYIVVHARGRATIRDDERYVCDVVSRLTRTHEASQPTPWTMSNSPQDYIDKVLHAIVGIEIEITGLAGKWKLSQNKEARDIQAAGEALKARGEDTIGDAMLVCAAAKNE